MISTNGILIDEAIRQYFRAQLPYDVILHFLSRFHNYSITKRHFHRVLRRLGLYRRKNKSPLQDVLLSIRQRIHDGPGRCYGHRTMHQLLRESGFIVDRETVRMGIKAIDPEGVELRSRRRLIRRTYRSRGPNYLLHIDGYDKLKHGRR